MAARYQREQPPISCPEIEHSPNTLGQRFQQHLLGDVAVRYLAGEILGYALGIGPNPSHRAKHIGRPCQRRLPEGNGSRSHFRSPSAVRETTNAPQQNNPIPTKQISPLRQFKYDKWACAASARQTALSLVVLCEN